MATYKVTVVEVNEYAETKTWYEGDDGKRYASTYAVPEGVKYSTKEYPTGQTLVRERDLYVQDLLTSDRLTEIIKAANGIK